jgi:hypothetical protein
MSNYTLKPIYVSGYIGGVAFYTDLKASSVASSITNIGEFLTAVDGSNSYLHRAHKRSWDLAWEYICYSGAPSYPLATVLTLQQLYLSPSAAGTDLVFGMDNQEYRVLIEPNSWQQSVAAITVSLLNKPYYNVSFRLVEQ